MKFNSKRLLELQKERMVTNYRLAKEIGVHQTTIKNWQEGCTPLLEHLGALCKYFAVPMDEFMQIEE